MSEFDIKASVIVPVCDNEKLMRVCLDSLVNQTIDKEKIEVILVSEDSQKPSAQICNEYAAEHPFFRVFTISETGRANARNFGLSKAEGKYIFYFEPNGSYSANVLRDVSEFFDEHYDETDMVTYKEVPIKNGKRRDAHHRYQTLKESGVYDLTADENIFISQNDINIAVKNERDKNILFDATPSLQQDSMLYCAEILRKKMKIGFVKDREHLRDNNFENTTITFSPLTNFDIMIKKWEDLFASFTDSVPKYYQALFTDDIFWKQQADILLPYHLDGEDFEIGLNRIKGLLQKIDNDIILSHPSATTMNKFYFIGMKHGESICFENDTKLRLTANGEVLYEADSVDIKITKFKIHQNEKAEVCGYLSSPVFSYSDKPQLLIKLNGKLIESELYESSFCFDNAKVKNNTAWGFRLVADTKEDVSFAFKVSLDERQVAANISCGEWVPFNKSINRSEFITARKKFKLTASRFIIKNIGSKEAFSYKIKEALKHFPKNIKVFIVRLLNLIIPFGRVWLYHDCKTSPKDNGYYQFIRDFEIKDGVKRYYVVNGNIDDVKDMFTAEQEKYLIRFRSNKHKLLYLAAEKIITAFIEKVNYVPFFDDVYKYYTDLFHADVIYLQHGVLHAHLPWKYSYDRLDIAAEVISTPYEAENLTKNYGFPESALIKSKMPRYDFTQIDENARRRILFAPSWRKYLITLDGNGSWIATPDKFLSSDYYKKTSEFLNSDELHDLLEKNDWYLDFKPHPIFTVYNEYFTMTNSRVNIVENADISDYKALVTDYSSFVFDFVYLERAIAYFLPDYREFKAGLNDYREVDIPFEDGFGPFTQNKDEAIAALSAIIKNDGKAIPPFDKRNAGFFFDKEKNCRDKIYEAINSI